MHKKAMFDNTIKSQILLWNMLFVIQIKPFETNLAYHI